MKTLLVMLWLMFSVFAVAFAASAENNSNNEPTFEIKQANYTYPGTFPPLGKIDFRNFTYRYYGSIETHVLSDGSVVENVPPPEEGFGGDSYELMDLIFEKENKSSSVAIIRIRHTNFGGSSESSDILQLLKWENSKLIVKTEVSFEADDRNGITYQSDNNKLLISSKIYLDSDSRCCPSKRDIGEFFWAGETLKFISHKIVNVER